MVRFAFGRLFRGRTPPMNRTIVLLAALLVCAATGCEDKRNVAVEFPARSDAPLEVQRFEQWTREYLADPSSANEAQGLVLASARRGLMQRLLREDPRLALELALSRDVA